MQWDMNAVTDVLGVTAGAASPKYNANHRAAAHERRVVKEAGKRGCMGLSTSVKRVAATGVGHQKRKNPCGFKQSALSRGRMLCNANRAGGCMVLHPGHTMTVIGSANQRAK